MTEKTDTRWASSGIEALDEILGGGFARRRLYLIQGDPGVGKTTLGMQFLLEGVARGEAAMYITLSESKEELTTAMGSHGWSLDGIHVHEISSIEEMMDRDEHQTLFHSFEVELGETVTALLEVVRKVSPARLVFDSISELRMLAGDEMHYRRQVLSLKQYFRELGTTVLLLDDRTTHGQAEQLRSLAHGVLAMEHMAPEGGGDRRRMRVTKVRGTRFRGGYHDYKILTGGITPFPRLIAKEHRQNAPSYNVSSGNAPLDSLVGGGLDSGTSTLLIGPSGVGKSTIAALFAVAAAERGDKSVIYLFDERVETMLRRSDSLGLNVREYAEKGLIGIRQLDPGELTPGEFSHLIRHEVRENGVQMVILDSLTGYFNSMPGENHLMLQIHELLSYLGQQGVTTLMIFTQQGMFAPVTSNHGLDVSYLADTVILFRYYELRGAIRQTLSIFKKRGGNHERTIRDLNLTPDGIQISEPLKNYHGVFTGVPVESHG